MNIWIKRRYGQRFSRRVWFPLRGASQVYLMNVCMLLPGTACVYENSAGLVLVTSEVEFAFAALGASGTEDTRGLLLG